MTSSSTKRTMSGQLRAVPRIQTKARSRTKTGALRLVTRQGGVPNPTLRRRWSLTRKVPKVHGRRSLAETASRVNFKTAPARSLKSSKLKFVPTISKPKEMRDARKQVQYILVLRYDVSKKKSFQAFRKKIELIDHPPNYTRNLCYSTLYKSCRRVSLSALRLNKWNFPPQEGGKQ